MTSADEMSPDLTDTRPFTEAIRGFRLDALTQDQFDGLPFGAIEVDGAGVIHRYNMTESLISGRKPERVIGRNFFREVAPCTNMPGFNGRFREGVEKGSLDCCFSFVFDFHMAPVRVEIVMRNGDGPDRYWILVRQVERLEPYRPDQAKATVAHRAGVAVDGEVVDLTVCERERIHVPGAIQPFGALLAIDADTLAVQVASANCADLLGRGPEAVVGRPLADVLGSTEDSLRQALAEGALDQDRAWEEQVWLPASGNVLLAAHRAGERVLVELESLAGLSAQLGLQSSASLRRAMADLRAAQTLPELAQAAAASIRQITGFDRVIIYRFDRDWHGQVVGEDKAGDWGQSFAGLHFPASDIPRQARALYVRSPVRHVPDRDYVPVPLLGAVEGAADAAEVDLSLSRLRSLSPVHMEYHRNMGVNGSLSISILQDGALWGLVACHHRVPHFVDPVNRAAAVGVADAFSLRIAGVVQAQTADRRRADTDCLNVLVAQMAGDQDFVAALSQGARRITDLFNAGGAAIIAHGAIVPVGAAPPEEFIRDLAAWIAAQPSQDGVFQTDSLCSLYTEATAHRDLCSGLLAVRVTPETSDFLMWFRPEEPQTLVWGGNPHKAMDMAEGSAQPLPRSSFERWVEERRGHACPWAGWEAEIARNLRQAVNEVMLQQLRHMADLTDKLRASDAAKSRFLANMSHELRTPLNAILGFSEVLASGLFGNLTPKQLEYVNDINLSGQHLLSMVSDVLDVARIEAGRLELRPEPVEVAKVIAESVALVRVRADAANLRLDVDAPEDLRAEADVTRLRQVLLNLLINAVKFTRPGGTVAVRAWARDGWLHMEVADTGIGMSADGVKLALEPFRQVSNLTKSIQEGAGLGLPISRMLVRLHGGDLSITSAPGVGTTVHLSFPARGDSHGRTAGA